MIINSQAFNTKGKDARRIYMELDSFRSRRPIDIIAKTNPIMIIDEPQSVEGGKKGKRNQTANSLGWFKPLMILRYSATHREDNKHNMVYRLDAMEAYNKKLVKKIAVKSVTTSGSTGTEGYLYLQGVVLSKDAPVALLEFETKGKRDIRKVTRKIAEKDRFNLYDNSGRMEQYQDGYIVTQIDGRDNSVTFTNGLKIHAGEVLGTVNEDQLRRIQIRETILSHIEREEQLFHKGIKVLSLFFIDEVAKYKKYDAEGNASHGDYAKIFEEEYQNIVDNMQKLLGLEDYYKYLKDISAESTHAGYFSIDKNKKTGKECFVNSTKVESGTTESNDSDAYDLIMKDKERLLDRKEPVRFIFSHSALREGWDNPNVFQICTLKQSSSSIRKRQEVGRGLRLSVNQNGERMDDAMLGDEVHHINVLTVVANESYDDFTRELQTEIAEAIGDRPRIVDKSLFVDKKIKDLHGNEQTISESTAIAIHESLIHKGYINKGMFTDKYYEDKKNGNVVLAEEVAECSESILQILDSVYDPKVMKPDNARNNNVDLSIDEDKLNKQEFKELWKRINSKSAYVVDFDTDELVKKSVAAINQELNVSQVFLKVEQGEMNKITSKADLEEGKGFSPTKSQQKQTTATANDAVKYDLIGKLVDETGLTRVSIVKILKEITVEKFDLFKINPEEFILKTGLIINEQKSTVIVQHIAYRKLGSRYETSIFTEPTLKGRLGENAYKTNKHLYDHVLYDSTNELNFAQKLDKSDEVAVYVKLPRGFYISTPVGKYNPDWAIAFYQSKVKHIYFVAETKGSLSSLQLRQIEKAKIDCARKHFKEISDDNVIYDVIDDFGTLLNKVMQ